MADKNRINHTKHLMKINSLSNPKQENKTIALQSKTIITSPPTQMDSNHTLNLNDIDDNTPSNERSLSATLKNIVTIPPLQGPSVYPSILNSTNINNNILSKPTQNETNPDKSQPQFFVPNNNAINKNIPNVLKVPSTGKLNTTLPYIGTAQLPVLTTSHNEALQSCVPMGMVNMPQLPLQQPVMLSTPPILQLHSPMYISSSSSLSPPPPPQPQPVVSYNQKLPQHNQYTTSMKVPIQSSVLQPIQGDGGVSTPWKFQKDMSPSASSKNNGKIGINIPPINKLSINRADSLPSKILNDTKGDQVQPLGKRDSVALERDNDSSPVHKVPLFINAATAAAATTMSTSTIINRGSTTDGTKEEPDNTQNGNGYENEPSVVKVTTTTATLDSSNSIRKEDTEGKAGNTNKIKNSLDDDFNETDNNDTVYSNKKSCRKVRDSKRALQNRNAQKAFRQRKEKYVKLLELKARKYDEVMQENFIMKKEILNLKNVILQMEQQIRIYNGYYSNYLQQQPQQLAQTQQLPHLPQLPLQFQSPPPQPPPAPPK